MPTNFMHQALPKKRASGDEDTPYIGMAGAKVHLVWCQSGNKGRCGNITKSRASCAVHELLCLLLTKVLGGSGCNPITADTGTTMAVSFRIWGLFLLLLTSATKRMDV